MTVKAKMRKTIHIYNELGFWHLMDKKEKRDAMIFCQPEYTAYESFGGEVSGEVSYEIPKIVAKGCDSNLQ